jgi:hypothetical protein
VKRTQILATLFAVIAVFTTSCGTGDKIGSVTVTAVGASGGIVNISGLGSTLQLHVTANYTSGKTIDETNFATYTVTPFGVDDTGTPLPAPPSTVSISKTGMITSVNPAVCVWENLGTTSTPSWFYQGDYQITATYRGFTSNPIYVPIASAADTITGQVGQCGPASSN